MTSQRTTHVVYAVLLTLIGACSRPARADQVLLEATPLVQGSLASVTSLDVSGPGTVTVTLSDLGWPDKLASLTFAATTPTGVLATLSGAGRISFTVSTAGIYDAVVGAVASPGFLGLGWYSLCITFAPSVPLPGGGWLLLSALAACALLWRGRRELPTPPTALTAIALGERSVSVPVS